MNDAEFGHGRDGADSFGPASLSGSADGQNLYILDSVKQRLLRFAVAEKGTRRAGNIGVPRDAQDFAPLSDGRVSVLEPNGRVTILSTAGKTLSQVDASLPQLKGYIASAHHVLPTAPRLIVRDGAPWIAALNQVQPVSAGSDPQWRPGTPSPDLRSLISVSPTMLTFPGPDSAHRTLEVSLLDPAGKLRRRQSFSFESDLDHWSPPQFDGEGNVYIAVTLKRARDRERVPLLLVLSPDLTELQRLQLLPDNASWPLIKRLHVSTDGSVWQMAPTTNGVDVWRLQQAGRRLACSNMPPPGVGPPDSSWSSLPPARLRFGEEHRCQAQRQGQWLRVRCTEHPRFGVPDKLTVELGRTREQRIKVVDRRGNVDLRERGLESYARGKAPPEQPFVEFVTRFTRGTRVNVGISWPKAYRLMELVWAEHETQPEWVGRLQQVVPSGALASCRGAQHILERDLKRSSLTQQQKRGLPAGLNRCLAGSMGAFTVSAERLGASNCGIPGCLDVKFVVSLRTPSGDRSAFMGPTLEFIPGSMTLEQDVLDFDADGSEDFYTIFRYRDGGGAQVHSTVWALDGQVRPLKGYPEWSFHAVKDMTGDAVPDLLTYGPFNEPVPQRCGIRACPERLTGPELLAHNQRPGDPETPLSFSSSASRTHLSKQCDAAKDGRIGGQSTPAELARVLVCQRMLSGKLKLDLRAARATQCNDPEECPIFDILDRWASMKLPR